MISPIPLQVGPNVDEVYPAPIPMPWDRGGEFVPLLVQGSFGNHLITLRLEYTVPPGKWALLTHALIRIEPPATAGTLAGSIWVADPGGTLVLLVHNLNVNSATPIHNIAYTTPVFIIVPEYYKIRLYTTNSSTDTRFFHVVAGVYIFNKLVG